MDGWDKETVLLALDKYKPFHVQFPGTSIPHELLNALPYLTNLQRLSLRSHPQEMNILTVKPLSIATLEPVLRCLNLRCLDMAYTDMNISLVSP